MIVHRIVLCRGPLTLITLGFVVNPALLRAQSAPVDTAALAPKLAAIEKTLDAEREKLHIPGVSLVIVKDDKIIDIKGFGLKDVAHKLPVTPDTLFAIGSSTKAFTAMTVMMSADEGKLALTDPPKKYLPYFVMRDKETDAKITLSDLLCHRSGLSRTDLAMVTGKLSGEELIRVACAAKPTAKLGEKFQYQNLMFLTAGTIVGKVQHTSWPNFVTKRILKPLGMNESNVSVKAMLRSPDHALGYAYDEDKKVYRFLPMRDIDQVAPAGAINSSAKDMAQWLRLMLGGGVFEGKRFVSEKNFNDLLVPHMNIAGNINYGYGWMLHDWKGHKVAEHGGNIDGFNAQVALMPDQHLGFVLLTNVTASSLGGTTMESVWKNLVDVPKTDDAPPSVDKSAAPAADIAQEVGDYKPPVSELALKVAVKEGKLTLTVPGQPTYTLENVGGRKYKLAAPVPDGYFVTFRPTKDDPKQSELYLEQPGLKMAFKRASDVAYVAPLSVDALIQKMIEAQGGEANLRKHHALRIKYALDLPTQGVTGEVISYARAPIAHTDLIRFDALGKTIGTLRTYFNGKEGGTEGSFLPASPLSQKQITESLPLYDFYAPLNWKSRFKSVVIQNKTKVNDEEVYVLVATPEKGNAITDYISVKTFLPLKRETLTEGPGGTPLPVKEVYGDYKPVDGVLLPCRVERDVEGLGEGVMTVKEARFDVPIPEKVFIAKGK